jgi:prepilin signal peptidase PulO-like enzyme (type II secretory pathway)
MMVELIQTTATSMWMVVAVCVALLAVFLWTAFMICRQFSKGTDPFKHWPFYLSAVVGLILVLACGATLMTVKGMILTLVLLYASLHDMKHFEVPNCIPIMIIILAFVGYEPQSLLSMLVGATVVFIPQLATTMLTPDRPIGGADIKISTALAFLLGAEKGIFALVVGMLFAVVITAVSNKINNRNQKQAFPLVPFLWVGATLAYMI